MKRILCTVLVICLVLGLCGLTSCQKLSETAHAKLDAAVEKMNSLEDFHLEWNFEIGVDAQGLSMELPINYDIKAVDATGDSPNVEINMSMAFLGNEVEMELYMEDDWVYVASEGQEYKTKNVAEEAGVSIDMDDSMESIIKPLPETIMKEAEFIRNSDGSETVTVSIDEKTFNEVFEDYMSIMGDMAQLGESGMDLKIKDAKAKITIKDGFIIEYAIDYKMVMEVSGVKATYTCNSVMNLVNPGKKVTLTPPKGYKEFEEFLSYDDLGDVEYWDSEDDILDDYDFGDIDDIDLGDYSFDEFEF